MEIRDLMVAFNLDNSLSLKQLYRKFELNLDDDDKDRKLKVCLTEFSKKGLDVASLKKLEREFKTAEKDKVSIMTVFDDDYPAQLKNIFDPPSVIYVKGKLYKEDVCPIAIVGSRRASFAGINFSRNLGFSLAMNGITIISGLARGIDSAAHKGCLEAGGRTIAVLGSGLGELYPAMNKQLAEQIGEKGAVISEFSYFTKPLAFNFPRRNRVISGLSFAVVVVEAAERSGSLITADLALEQGREVFAVPGFANAPNSKGTNKLIKQGAVLVESDKDIIDALPDHIKDKFRQKEKDFGKEIEKKLDKEVLNVYNLLTVEPISVDSICNILNISVAAVLKNLLDLQLKGLITQMPGKVFCRKK
ncbi:MAG: DNA-processing protein DprA [Candidatus Omnitrophota bacterium]